ncbi:MAG: AmmeMemoRadiSam system protein B, partial [Candidatus Altiarchaeota archaeon]
KEKTDSTTTTLAETVRKPAVAGAFYPSDKTQLSKDIDTHISQAKDYHEVYGIRGFVSPHAGYVYSGPVAAYGYRQLMKSRYETVIVMGPSHYVYLTKASIPNVNYYETPLGRVLLSPKVKDMLKEEMFTSDPKAEEKEHSVEVQVPFLQKVLPPFKIIPIVVGDVDPVKLADALMKYVDDDTLIVASSDLSHYKPYDQCVATDKNTVDAIVNLDSAKMAKEGDACGRIPILTLMEIAKREGWRTKVFDYRNSGDTAGDKNQGVVGYSSIGFYDGLDTKEQRFLLDLAQETLVRHYRGEDMKLDETKIPPKLLEDKACFVTLNKNKQLRGCIGHLVPQEKLYRCVIDNALNAALNDGRFEQVTEDELKDIKIEVSVLSIPKPLKYDSPDDLLAKLIPGVDGVIIRSGQHQSTYLPVVWDQLPNKEEFLGQLCLKGGSPANCWKTAEIQTYQTQEFHQEGFK